jgi:hypothetical protein
MEGEENLAHHIFINSTTAQLRAEIVRIDADRLK